MDDTIPKVPRSSGLVVNIEDVFPDVGFGGTLPRGARGGNAPLKTAVGYIRLRQSPTGGAGTPTFSRKVVPA